jgi:hypothetical protein
MDPKTFLFSPRLENPMVINMTHSECYAALALKFIASLEEIDPVIRGFSGQFFMATRRFSVMPA